MATDQDAPEPASGSDSSTVAPSHGDAGAPTPSHQPSTSAFWHRVKEHKVAQWTIAYGAAAYTLLHIVEMVSDALDWPHLIVRIVTLSLILGTPVAATLAWYHGHRALRRVSGPELAILTILLVIAASVLWFLGRPRDEHVRPVQAMVQQSAGSLPQTTAALPDKSIAVLPFVDMSEKRDQGYFSDGLSEELIDSLTKIPELHVPARTSSFYFKDRQTTIAEIAKGLSVAYVLEGSVRKAGNRLRITAQLVRADNGYHLWSETYDRQFDDIFKIQDEIAAAVVTALKVSLLERAEAHEAPTVSTEAYTLYLQARAIAQTAPQRIDYQRATEYLQRALTLDPAFARAWAALASYQAYAYEYYNVGKLGEVLSGSTRAVSRALELNPMLSEGYAARAQILYDLEWNWPGAREAIGHALAIDARNADAYQWASAISRIQGRFDEATDLARKAVAHDPLNAWSYGTVGNACLAGGRLDDAEAAWRKAVELAPAMSQMHLLLGIALVANHKPAAALEQMELETDERYRDVGRALALDGLNRRSEADRELATAEAKYVTVVSYPIAQVYANRDDPDRALASLERAYQLHDGWVPWTPWDPLLKNLRKDPRYSAFLRKIHLPD